MLMYDRPTAAKFLRESNCIEGIPKTEEAYLIGLSGNKLNDLHIDNSIAAWKWMASKAADKPMEIEDLLHLHTLQMTGLMDNPLEVGSWRTGNVTVGGDIPPSAAVLHYHLAGFFDHFKLNQDDSMAIHLHFETIHPFWDGNGRVGRLVWAWHRLWLGEPVYPILNEFRVPQDLDPWEDPNSFINKRARYYEAIREYRDGKTGRKQRGAIVGTQGPGGAADAANAASNVSIGNKDGSRKKQPRK